MKKLILLLLVAPLFASVHAGYRTTAFVAKTSLKATKESAKLASYPVRHSKKSAKGVAKVAVKAVATAF
jgi:hypothetical protein